MSGQAGVEPRDGYTAIGVVVRPHGIRGEVRVHTFAPDAPNLLAGRSVTIGAQVVELIRVRPTKGAWLVELRGVTSRPQAEELRGRLIELPDAEVEREEGAHFVYELIGLRVETVDGRDLGEVVDVLQPGANDVYVVRGPAGEVLIPAIHDVVDQIDLPGRRLVVRDLPGMLPDST